jgi:hypothetical protein
MFAVSERISDGASLGPPATCAGEDGTVADPEPLPPEATVGGMPGEGGSLRSVSVVARLLVLGGGAAPRSGCESP